MFTKHVELQDVASNHSYNGTHNFKYRKIDRK